MNIVEEDTKKELKSITVKIPSSDYRILRINAAEEMTSVSGILRELIEKHIAVKTSS